MLITSTITEGYFLSPIPYTLLKEAHNTKGSSVVSGSRTPGGKFLGRHKLAFTIGLFGVLGILTLIATRAAVPTASVEVEAGSRTTNATLTADTSASGSAAVKFGAGSTTPPGEGTAPIAHGEELDVNRVGP